MAVKEEIIFEPAQTPNQNWIKELDSRHMDSSFNSFRAPKNDTRVITLCKPFVVFSKNSYSSPVTLPLGLAYLGGVLEKDPGIAWQNVQSQGEGDPSARTRLVTSVNYLYSNFDHFLVSFFNFSNNLFVRISDSSSTPASELI